MAKPQKPSANMLSRLQYAGDDEAEEYETITVERPLGGLYDLGTPFLVPPEGASTSTNVTYESLGIEKVAGCVQVGAAIQDLEAPASPPNPDPRTCHWGYQHITKDGVKTLLRVNGKHLYKLIDSDPDPDNWTWVGAVSGSVPCTPADVIGSGVNLGTAVQKADRIHYADGGALRRMYIPGTPPRIAPWGSDLTLPAGVIDGEIDGGGLLLSARRYSFVWQLINEDTGFQTNWSAVSNVVETAGAGDDSALAITLPKVENWTSDWSIARIARSPGAVPPATPAIWKVEMDIEGIENLDLFDHMGGILTILDGNLGAESSDDSAMIPKARYVLYDPQGDRCVAFGDPDNPNVLYWSEDGDFGSFPSTNATPPIEDNDGDPLQGGAVLEGRIYLLKRYHGLFEATLNAVGAYAVEKKTNAVGCVSHHSIVTRGARLYWLSSEGAIECVGGVPTNISDDRIRKLMERIATSDHYVDAYGLEERRSGSAFIHWLVKDPTVGRVFRLVWDLGLRAWTIHDETAQAGGSRTRVLFSVLDDDDGDNTWHAYTADTTGRCFRLGTDVFGESVYSNNGLDYAMDWKTPWFGNGKDTYVPRYIDFLSKVVPVGLNAGALRVSLYVDGRDAAQHEADFLIRNETQSDRMFETERFRCDSRQSPCRMFRFGFSHSVKDGAPLVPWYEIKFSRESARLRGRQRRVA